MIAQQSTQQPPAPQALSARAILTPNQQSQRKVDMPNQQFDEEAEQDGYEEEDEQDGYEEEDEQDGNEESGQDEDDDRPWEITKQTFEDIDEMSPPELEGLLENIRDHEDWSDLRERAKRRTTQWLGALKKADVAPRCSHVKLDGRACGSPAMNGSTTCYQHGDERPKRLAEQAARILEAPLLENRASVQMAITRICGMLATKEIDQAIGRTMIAALQLAQRNIGEKKSIYE
jgi:hypothetical protein